jgi:hypothetical protein
VPGAPGAAPAGAPPAATRWGWHPAPNGGTHPEETARHLTDAQIEDLIPHVPDDNARRVLAAILRQHAGRREDHLARSQPPTSPLALTGDTGTADMQSVPDLRQASTDDPIRQNLLGAWELMDAETLQRGRDRLPRLRLRLTPQAPRGPVLHRLARPRRQAGSACLTALQRSGAEDLSLSQHLWRLISGCWPWGLGRLPSLAGPTSPETPS